MNFSCQPIELLVWWIDANYFKVTKQSPVRWYSVIGSIFDPNFLLVDQKPIEAEPLVINSSDLSSWLLIGVMNVRPNGFFLTSTYDHVCNSTPQQAVSVKVVPYRDNSSASPPACDSSACKIDCEVEFFNCYTSGLNARIPYMDHVRNADPPLLSPKLFKSLANSFLNVVQVLIMITNSPHSGDLHIQSAAFPVRQLRRNIGQLRPNSYRRTSRKKAHQIMGLDVHERIGPVKSFKARYNFTVAPASANELGFTLANALATNLSCGTSFERVSVDVCYKFSVHTKNDQLKKSGFISIEC